MVPICRVFTPHRKSTRQKRAPQGFPAAPTPCGAAQSPAAHPHRLCCPGTRRPRPAPKHQRLQGRTTPRPASQQDFPPQRRRGPPGRRKRNMSHASSAELRQASRAAIATLCAQLCSECQVMVPTGADLSIHQTANSLTPVRTTATLWSHSLPRNEKTDTTNVSTFAKSVSFTAPSFAHDPSKNRGCLRAERSMIASSYT